MAIPRRPGINHFLKMLGISLVIHIALVAFFNLNLWPMIIKVQPAAYTVTLMPVSIREPEIPKSPVQPAPKEEKIKPVEKPKKDDIVEKVKKPPKESLKHLQEALEEIRKKAALEEIKKRVARKERDEKRLSSIQPSPAFESKMNEYYSLVWTKIKEAWTIPENLIKEMVDLETVIVLIISSDGTIQKMWFEKKSGNALYDQSAMRAIKKAEPLPPIPRELNEDTLEIGIRFFPD
jgi:TonB family protein